MVCCTNRSPSRSNASWTRHVPPTTATVEGDMAPVRCGAPLENKKSPVAAAYVQKVRHSRTACPKLPRMGRSYRPTMELRRWVNFLGPPNCEIAQAQVQRTLWIFGVSTFRRLLESMLLVVGRRLETPRLRIRSTPPCSLDSALAW